MKRRSPPSPELDAAARAIEAYEAPYWRQLAAFVEAYGQPIDEASGQLPPPKSAEIIPFKKRPK
jgi:hypothetical protein